MSGPIPNLQFQPYNPMDTAIKTALSVFNAGMQGQNMRTQNQMNQASMPYIGPTAEAQMKQLQMQNQMYPELTNANIANMSSQNKKREADIRLQQQMMAMLGMGGGNEGQPMPAGGNMATGAGMPSMGGQQDNFGGQEQPQANPGMQNPNMQPQPGMNQQPMGLSQSYPGLPSYGETAAKKYFNLPEMSPQQQLLMDAYKNQQNQVFNKNLEATMGTNTNLTKKQNQSLAIENLMPSLAEYINSDIPFQRAALYGNEKTKPVNPLNIHGQADYTSQLGNLKDMLAAAKDVSTTSEGLKTMEDILSKRPGEMDSSFKKRLRREEKNLIDIYERETGKKYTGVRSGAESGSWMQEAENEGYRKGADGKWYQG